MWLLISGKVVQEMKNDDIKRDNSCHQLDIEIDKSTLILSTGSKGYRVLFFSMKV